MTRASGRSRRVSPRSLEGLAVHLKDRDVRAIVRGALDLATYWVLFGPGDSGGWRVDNYVWRNGKWQPDGDSIGAGAAPSDGWDLLGSLFVRAFTAAE